MIMVRYGERGEEEGGRGWSAARCDGREEAVGGLGEGECGDTEATSNARVGRACPHLMHLRGRCSPRFVSLF